MGNGMENGTETGKVVLNPYQFNDFFFFFPKDALVSFTFAGKVHKCLVTGS